MWTLQESVLCGSVLCLCGSSTLPMVHFYALSSFIYFSLNFGIWPGSSIDAAVSLRAAWRTADLRDHIARKGHISVLLALDSAWNRESSDPKDKVMGLMGLVGARADLAPEYSWSLPKIYRSCFRAALQEEGDLSCLGFISENPAVKKVGLPSWVPDFETHSSMGSDYFASLSKPIFCPRIYNACRFEHRDTALRLATEEDDSVLVLDGILVDTVQNIGPKAPGWDPSDNDEFKDREWTEAMRSVVNDWRAMMPCPAGLYRTGETSSRAFWRTVLVDLKQGSYPEPCTACGPERLDIQSMPWLTGLELKENLEQLLLTWSLSCTLGFRQLRLIEQFNRRLFVTATGYVGLGPPSLQPGDAICILLGGAVAYALRRVKDDRWRYVGEW